jgi:hypothetical protein
MVVCPSDEASYLINKKDSPVDSADLWERSKVNLGARPVPCASVSIDHVVCAILLGCDWQDVRLESQLGRCQYASSSRFAIRRIPEQTQ